MEINKEILDYINSRVDKEEDDRHKALENASVRITMLEEGSVKRSMFTWVVGILISISLVAGGALTANLKEVKGELNAYQDQVFNRMGDLSESVAVIQTHLKFLTEELKNLQLIDE